MSVLYHLMTPRPRTPMLDAVVQVAAALRAQTGGEIVYLNPARRPGSFFPERLYGLHRLLYLRRQESHIQLHHVFNPHLFYFPYLRWLRRPIVYTITAGLRATTPRDLSKLGRLSALIVSSEREAETLRRWGLENVHLVRPGIDTSRFSPTPPPAGPGFALLSGSAPWTEAQFQGKGVLALLDAAQAQPDLRLVFLWRGLLFDQMQARVAERGLGERITVIDRPVDVNQVLSQVHAAVVLAADASLVKAFPHSALEALAAGRPVLVSRALPMARYVARTGCGKVVDDVSPQSVLEALQALRASYDACQAAALEVGRRDFSLEAMVEGYLGVLER